MAKIISFAV